MERVCFGVLMHGEWVVSVCDYGDAVVTVIDLKMDVELMMRCVCERKRKAEVLLESGSDV